MPESLNAWIELIQEQEMPIFSNTLQRIQQVSQDTHSGAGELAEIILQDPNLTAKVLRLCNSVFYNPTTERVNTVSRALIVLGLHRTQEIAIACSFIEAISNELQRTRVNFELAKTLLAAVQSREFAVLAGDKCPEEVFIAALLHRLGHIAFWSFGRELSEKLHAQLLQKDEPANRIEKRVLGFSLDQLGYGLMKAWQIGGLIRATLDDRKRSDRRVAFIKLAYQLSELLQAGARREALIDCVDDIAGLCGRSPKYISLKLEQWIQDAVLMAQHLEVKACISQIPRSWPVEEGRSSHAALESPSVETDAECKLRILKDITDALSGSIDLNIFFPLAMESIHRGLHMKRTLLALFNSETNTLVERSSLGWADADWPRPMIITLRKGSNNIFSATLERGEPCWFKPDNQEHASLYTDGTGSRFGRLECFLAPVRVMGKPIAMIYSDRGPEGNSLGEADYDYFCHVSQLSNIGMALAKRQS